MLLISPCVKSAVLEVTIPELFYIGYGCSLSSKRSGCAMWAVLDTTFVMWEAAMTSVTTVPVLFVFLS